MDAEALDLLRRSLALTLDTEGRWLHEGAHFDNQRIADLFSRGIDLHPETQEAVVHIGNQWAYFTPVDEPYIALRLIFGDGTLEAELNTFSTVPLGTDSLLCSEEGVIYARLDERRVARLSRRAHAQLTDVVEETEAGPVVQVGDQVWPINER
ncbi:MAG: hypothetical protein ACE366_05595 [Bradymonadia bacterium]